MSGLGGLFHASCGNVGRRLLFAFVEIWHVETNTFHLPIGEMTTTFDDVSNFLHLPIVGQFYTHQRLDADGVNDLLAEPLRVCRGVAAEETRHCRGAHVRLSWLRDVYEKAMDCSSHSVFVSLTSVLLQSVSYTWDFLYI